MGKSKKKYDLFISYAGEDRDAFVQPLVDELKKAGLNVWYDKFCLEIGDSLRAKIDEGMSQSEYGIVVLSPNFFNKRWPTSELDALISLQNNGHISILPIWKDVGREDVEYFSPILAGIWALQAYEGIEKTAYQLARKIDPENDYLKEKSQISYQGFDVRITVLPNMKPFGAGPYKEDRNYLLIEVCNWGERPVVIEKAGLSLRRKEKPHLIASDSFYFGPRRLGDGDKASYLIEQDQLDLKSIESVWAIDAVGRKWTNSVQLTNRSSDLSRKRGQDR